MAIVTIDELLERASQFEERLEDGYARIRDACQDDGVRLLTYYLVRHCRHLDKAVSSFDPEQVKKIGKIRLKHDVEFDPSAVFAVMDKPATEITGQELLDAAVSHDSSLIELYRGILKQPLTSDAVALLEALIRVEERDIVMLKKTMATHLF